MAREQWRAEWLRPGSQRWVVGELRSNPHTAVGDLHQAKKSGPVEEWVVVRVVTDINYYVWASSGDVGDPDVGRVWEEDIPPNAGSVV